MHKELEPRLHWILACVSVALAWGALATPATASPPPTAWDDPAVQESFQALTAYDGNLKDEFGKAVDVEWDRAIVGAPGNQGAAYVFVRSGGHWVLDAKLRPSSLSHPSFGRSVCIEGDIAVVGEPAAGSRNDGRVHVFERTDSGWVKQDELEYPAYHSSYSGFGASLALSGDTVLIGASNSSDSDLPDGAGSAHIFRKEGSDWVEEAFLLSPNPTLSKDFGSGVALDGDVALVSEPQTGVYVYERSGTTWHHDDTLPLPNDPKITGFGGSVSLDGTCAAISASSWGGFEEYFGCVYIFSEGAAGWDQTAQLFSPDQSKRDWFGQSVSLSGDTLLVGSSEEIPTSYVFRYVHGDWVEMASLSPQGAETEDQVGVSVAIDGDNCFIGAPEDPIQDATGKGTVYAVSLGLNYIVGKNIPLTVAGPGVLENDIGTLSSLSAVLADAPLHGVVALSEDGGFTYTPNPGWFGSDTFSYRAYDGASFSNTATANVLTLDTATVSGKVVSTANGLPLAGIVVRAVCRDDPEPETSLAVWTAMTNADGEYEIVGIPAGRYHLTYIDPADAYRDMQLGYWGIPVEYSPYIELNDGESLSEMNTDLFPLAESLVNRCERLSGSSRYETAVEISRMRKSADVAVLVSGTNFPDALSASALAGAYDAPILLSPAYDVPELVLAELDRLGVKQVIVVGGTAAVSNHAIGT
ncbi:MAG: cell wall-binding repeat-containing protein, partial [Actinomycetota bacterium]|nr:cell wall-binding repeat-containing protein [Actinomycetota bacterium]